LTASQYSFKLAQLRPASASPLQTRLITPSKFARSWPPSVSTHSLDHCLQVHLHTRSIAAFKCIGKLARLRPPSASPYSLDHSLQVYRETHLIMASKCISKFARSRPPKCIFKLARSRPPKCISILPRSRPRHVSQSSLDRHFQAHLELLSSTACSQSRYTMCRWVAI
jgi:hypothetical protein